MKLMKFLAASSAVLGMMAASPAVFAHATYNVAPTAGAPQFLNGNPGAAWPASGANIPATAYVGIHSLTNARVIETGVYGPKSGTSGAPTTAQLGGVFAGVTPVTGDNLLGQLYNFNNVTNASTPANQIPVLAQGPYTTQAVSVAQNSWANGIYDGTNFNTGLQYLDIHASTGAGANLEANLMATVNYINVTMGADNYAYSTDGTATYAGQNELSYAIYQGFATGAGLQGLSLLGTGQASLGGTTGFSIQLTGQTLNGPGTSGEYTLIIGDSSGSLSASSYDPFIKVAVVASTSAAYSTVVSAVPVPGAVWLFGSALAGFIGFGRRKPAITA